MFKTLVDFSSPQNFDIILKVKKAVEDRTIVAEL